MLLPPLSVLHLCRLDRNGDASIDWVEWRDYFQLSAVDSLNDMVSIWRKNVSLFLVAAVFLTFCLSFLSSFVLVTEADNAEQSRILFLYLMICFLYTG